MTIKSSKYNIHNGNEFDTYYFDTGVKSVKVLNSSKTEVGNIEELIFTGKKHITGNITDIKISGLHTVKGVSGLPDVVSKNVETLVFVKAVGEINNPTFISYEVIDDKGNIFHKTVVGSRQSDWSEGGTGLENILSDLSKKLGVVSGLRTQNKDDLVSALNELKELADNNKTSIERATTQLSNHNHDTRYIRSDQPSELNSNITLGQNTGFSTKINGQYQNVLKSSNNGLDISLGNTLSSLNIIGSRSDLTYNNKKIWTESNDGNGSGLDADMLDGLHSSSFAKINETNSFTKKQSILEVETDFITGKSGTITIKSGSNGIPIKVFNNGAIQSTEANIIGTPSKQPSINLVKHGEANGVILQRNISNDIGLQLYNNIVRKQVFKVPTNDNVLWFDREIGIQGKKLYIQDTQPEGNNHPIGSIWIS